MSHPRLPIIIQPILDDYRSMMSQQLPGLLNGFYVVGSTALDGFDENFEDDHSSELSKIYHSGM